MKLFRVVRWSHRWLGLILLLQVVIWAVSGLVMISLPEGQVEGDRYLNTLNNESFSKEQWLQASELLTGLVQTGETPDSVSLKRIGKKTVLQVVMSDTRTKLYGLEDGNQVRLGEKEISDVAGELLKGRPGLLFVGLIRSHSREYQGELPVWKVIADDAVKSHLYIDPYSGELIAHRTRFWRWHRFSYDLHTFNFSGASGINNPVLAILATGMLMLTISGAVLLVQLLIRSRSGR